MLRVTIRELMLLTAFIAIAFASLKYGGQVLWIVLANAVAALVLIAVVVALVDRGRRQAIASGFASCAAIYLALMFTVNVGDETWVTELFLDKLHPFLARQTWFDRNTGQEVTFDPQWEVHGLPANVGGLQRPGYRQFLVLGHLFWAIAFGYLGSRFAACIYARREREQNPTTAPSKT